MNMFDERGAAVAIGECLPFGWSVALQTGQAGTELVLHATDGREARLAVVARRRVEPREVPYLLAQNSGQENRILLVVPFLSPRARELLTTGGMNFVDGTGNLRLVVSSPAIFLAHTGADRDPERKPRPLRSLKGAAAGRVVRALCDFLPPYGVRELAESSSTPLGTVSRVVSLLEEEALLIRDKKKRIVSVDWPALIARWVRDYSVLRSNTCASFIEPRGLEALKAKLSRLDRYAVTGSLVGSDIAPARLAMIYVDDVGVASEQLEIVSTDVGANVWLLEPYDAVVFERTQMFRCLPQGELCVAAAQTQVIADLLTSPGRGPQEGEALLTKLRGTENAWRSPL